MALWDRLRGLAVNVEAFGTERKSVDVSSQFTRVSTTVVLGGDGAEGRGEDVTYTAQDHDWFPELEPPGRTTLQELSEELDGVQLFDGEPGMPASRDYRRWAFESAALDLALRQNELSLGAALEREYRPVRFVVSTRDDAFAWLEHNPELELKLDPENDWDRPFMERLAGTGRVRVLDLKAYYTGTPVDVVPDPELYRAVVELFPDVVLEDASLDGECGTVLQGQESRLSFDAPIHSVADVRALPVEPGWLNIKPSRFGTTARLLECIEDCAARGVQMYGGGQFELGVGRRHIQVLASLFYPGGPNDVAPSEYNAGRAARWAAPVATPATGGRRVLKAGKPFERHAPSQRALRTALQPTPRPGRPPLSEPILRVRHRERRASPERDRLRRRQPGPGGARRATDRLALDGHRPLVGVTVYRTWQASRGRFDGLGAQGNRRHRV